MNTRENRYNVGIQNKRRASNAVQSDCGLNERYYATSSGAGTEKEREKERKKKDSFEIKIGKEEELGEKKEQQR